MAGNFVSPSGATPKMKHGKPNRPKRTAEVQSPFPVDPEYPITDSFASREIPSFRTRRASDNPKSGFNTVPTKASRSGMAEFVKVSAPERGRGKTVGHDS
jgi:hypothetical protein